jgi:hypothetical protein
MPERKIDPETLAYYAAILDGEGSIGIIRKHPNRANPSYQLGVSLYNKDKAILDRAHELFGGGKPWQDKRDGSWQWAAWSSSAAEFLKAVMPYMGMKVEQARLGLWHQEEAEARSARGVPPSELAFRAWVKEAISTFNQQRQREAFPSPVLKGPNGRMHLIGAVPGRFATHPGGEPTLNDDAYAAGIFDGEGSVGVPRDGHRHLIQVSVGNSNFEMLEHMEALYGGRVGKESRWRVFPRPPMVSDREWASVIECVEQHRADALSGDPTWDMGKGLLISRAEDLTRALSGSSPVFSDDPAVAEVVKLLHAALERGTLRTREGVPFRAWQAKAAAAGSFLERIAPHVRVKERQVALALRVQSTMGSVRSIPPELAAERERCREIVRKLNRYVPLTEEETAFLDETMERFRRKYHPPERRQEGRRVA